MTLAPHQTVTIGINGETRSLAADHPHLLAALREELDILKKAAAWFARETGSVPPRDSSS